jgi:hypothetical protein
MAFDSPSAAKSAMVWVTVAPIWLYPIVCLVCIALAWNRYSSQRFGYAQLFSWAPLIYVVLLVNVFPSATKLFSQPRYSKAQIADGKRVFDDKCKNAKEVIFSKPAEIVEGLFFATPLPPTYSRIANGQFGSIGSPLHGYSVIAGGYLRFYEEQSNHVGSNDGSNISYKRYRFRDAVGEVTNELKSNYALKYVVETTEQESSLGLDGGSIEVVRINTNAVLARTTFFSNRFHNWFCGYAPDNGHFGTFFFLERALDLSARFKPDSANEASLNESSDRPRANPSINTDAAR